MKTQGVTGLPIGVRSLFALATGVIQRRDLQDTEIVEAVKWVVERTDEVEANELIGDFPPDFIVRTRLLEDPAIKTKLLDASAVRARSIRDPKGDALNPYRALALKAFLPNLSAAVAKANPEKSFREILDDCIVSNHFLANSVGSKDSIYYLLSRKTEPIEHLNEMETKLLDLGELTFHVLWPYSYCLESANISILDLRAASEAHRNNPILTNEEHAQDVIDFISRAKELIAGISG